MWLFDQVGTLSHQAWKSFCCLAFTKMRESFSFWWWPIWGPYIWTVKVKKKIQFIHSLLTVYSVCILFIGLIASRYNGSSLSLQLRTIPGPFRRSLKQSRTINRRAWPWVYWEYQVANVWTMKPTAPRRNIMVVMQRLPALAGRSRLYAWRSLQLLQEPMRRTLCYKNVFQGS